jgi:hypothetical protein
MKCTDLKMSHWDGRQGYIHECFESGRTVLAAALTVPKVGEYLTVTTVNDGFIVIMDD